ncbi:MAG: ribonuclease HII [Winogradskyella sp.]|nr:ribonuclease HII [Winogradskyella sp.]
MSLLIGCNSDFKSSDKSYQYIPKGFNTIIKINSLNEFISQARNNEVFKALKLNDSFDSIKILNYLNSKQDIFLAVNDNKYIIVTQNDSTLMSEDSKLQIDWSESKNKIHKVAVDTSISFIRIINSVFVASNDEALLNTIKKDIEARDLYQLIETTNPTSVASVIYLDHSPEFDKLIYPNLLFDSGYKQPKVFDLDLIEHGFSYSGVISSKDDIHNFLLSFKNTLPQKNFGLSIAPATASEFVSLTFNDYSIFNHNISQLTKRNVDSLQTNFLKYANEVSYISTDSKKAISVHVLDTNLALDYIENKSFKESYRNIDIYTLAQNNFFKSRLLPFIDLEFSEFLTVYDDFVIVSSSLDYLKEIISSAQSGNTLINSDLYQSVKNNLTQESSLLQYKNSKVLSEILNADLKDFDSNFLQLTHENDHALINGVVQKYKKPAAPNSVKEVFSTSLDNDIISSPQFVKNHINGTNEIVVQDIDNRLYLISNSGKVLWKKQINGKILGNIEQVDMYKNGRLQLAFTTSHRLYIIDRNGKDVSPFPLKFKDEVTQPLSVFDYDNNWNYRLMVTQGKNVLLYNIKGQTVTGFTFNATDSAIITRPKHYRIGNKDYIVFLTEKRMKIIDRRGRTRINVKAPIESSGNNIYLYKNKFVTSNTIGQLVQVDTKGNVTYNKLNLSDSHDLVTTSKTLVTLDGNKLKIKSKTIDLDYGQYTQPKIFYLNDKIYVAVTDLQTNKVYLFDSQTKPIPNFPVYGNSGIDLKTAKQKTHLEFVVKGDRNSVILYNIN